MRTTQREVFVYLTGGLGNQLFQITSALSALADSPGVVFLDLNLGAPRRTEGKVDCLFLNLPDNVVPLNKPASKFVKQVAGYLLRSGISPKKWETKIVFKIIYRLIGRVILSIRYKRFLSLQVASNVGRFTLEPKKRTMLIGYFQTFNSLKHLDRVKISELMRPIQISLEVKSLIERAFVEKPIFLHIRLTDYLLEKNFGNLNTNYYRECLEVLFSQERRIWVFSDDIEKAKEILPNEYEKYYFFVKIEDKAPAELLYLLRHGFDYVIANSTFSWWAATTRVIAEGNVIAPSPWFARMPEPLELIPPEWMRKQVLY